MIDQNKKGRRYDALFKADAVALVRQGRPQTKVAAELGLSPETIARWLSQATRAAQAAQDAKAAAGQPHGRRKAAAPPSPEQCELARLRRELQEVSLQRDILKKALAICSAGILPPPALKS
jgi:transposase-like protein